MTDRIDAFVREVARPGSRLGGGSLTALSAALSAALLEKITPRGTSRVAGAVRRRCVRLVARDAEVFDAAMRVLKARGRGAAFASALRRAAELQLTVHADARSLVRAGRAGKASVKPKFESDWRCAMALAQAAASGAAALARANAAWLGDRQYGASVAKRLKSP